MIRVSEAGGYVVLQLKQGINIPSICRKHVVAAYVNHQVDLIVTKNELCEVHAWRCITLIIIKNIP